MFYERRLVEVLDGLSDREPACGELVRAMPGGIDVIDVLVSLSSVIAELCDVSPCRSDVESVEAQTFSISKKRAHCCTDTREEMRYEGSTVITPPLSRRRMTPPTCAKFVYLLCEGPRKVRRRRKRVECERRNNHRKDKTVSGKKFQ